MYEYAGDDEWTVYDGQGRYVGHVIFEPHTGAYTAVALRDDEDVDGFDTLDDAADYVSDYR
jgi:hypothetical protein